MVVAVEAILDDAVLRQVLQMQMQHLGLCVIMVLLLLLVTCSDGRGAGDGVERGCDGIEMEQVVCPTHEKQTW